MNLNKKAQQSRNDLLGWYVASLMIVLVAVGSMYGLGIIGNYQENGHMIDSNKITAAAVAVPQENITSDNANISQPTNSSVAN